jgi:hypothetical protein
VSGIQCPPPTRNVPSVAYKMNAAKEQDKYKYRPRNWRRLSRLDVLRLERALRSLEEEGLMKFVDGRWYKSEYAPKPQGRSCHHD